MQIGNADLMRTACRAIMRDERSPYTSDMTDGIEVAGMLLSGATPTKKPSVMTADASTV